MNLEKLLAENMRRFGTKNLNEQDPNLQAQADAANARRAANYEKDSEATMQRLEKQRNDQLVADRIRKGEMYPDGREFDRVRVATTSYSEPDFKERTAGKIADKLLKTVAQISTPTQMQFDNLAYYIKWTNPMAFNRPNEPIYVPKDKNAIMVVAGNK